MKLGEIYPVSDAKLADIEIKGITCDSRAVEQGFLFVCIKGVSSDGHAFAADAVKKGAELLFAKRI